MESFWKEVWTGGIPSKYTTIEFCNWGRCVHETSGQYDGTQKYTMAEIGNHHAGADTHRHGFRLGQRS